MVRPMHRATAPPYRREDSESVAAREVAVKRHEVTDRRDRSTGDEARERLLAGLPVTERRLDAAGISTALLEGGDGPPIVLLHGPGEFAEKWFRVIPHLVRRHRVVAPDLPAHGASSVPDTPLTEDRVLSWLGDLIERTCQAPPVLVGHVLGGAIGARFAISHRDRLRHLVLVDTLGLGRFRPNPKFGLTLLGFQARPNERTYTRFMRQCSADLDDLRAGMGDRWDPFVAYTLDRARSPRSKTVGRLFREVGLPQIPPGDLATISVPTALIWGREDKANRLRTAEAASARYGWPLHVIDDCADDPARDRPEAFLAALAAVLGTGAERGAHSGREPADT
jgi:pimeloyl-ACP methyl ester carboxylesterase